MKNPPKKTLRNKCDTCCSLLCCRIGKCERCGCETTLQWCHFVSRAVIRLRYKPLNFACLCYGCHTWGHHHPRAFSDFWDKLKGAGTSRKLERMANENLEPITIEWYQKIFNTLNQL